MAKIALVAADFGESKCLASISRELRQRRHETIEWFGYGNGLVPHPGLVESVTTNIDWLLLALSENNQEEAVLAQKAAAEKIPIAVYAPGKNTYRLRSAAPLRPLTNLLFGHAEELDATAILFVNAKVVPAGNILHEDFYSPYSRETARAKLKMSDGQNLIFVPGDKRRGINWPLFHSVIEAAHRPEVQTHKPMVAIGLHPGDPDPKESYGELARFRWPPVISWSPPFQLWPWPRFTSVGQ
ncbi:MAG: hypothetical protein HYV66_02680 [Candidatus Sungbacteria bacterium]|uniref:Uncharacterized protein n=1 Tax=Candidatus Sungiibacteriota bacterium TaxID=2750080 RepID=A0A931YDZ9_9BACT|nr:hypothetical protein [Candidatus Sungbacteria bacterium]